MDKILLNKNQAQKFAQAILADIEMYVENHLEEYERFLRDEEQEVQDRLQNYQKRNEDQ